MAVAVGVSVAVGVVVAVGVEVGTAAVWVANMSAAACVAVAESSSCERPQAGSAPVISRVARVRMIRVLISTPPHSTDSRCGRDIFERA
ncbi:MAG: hypothetical protein CEE40_13015 [Chloroflexi bacterium B3_Chlor]|nr:MAG: hypothetical protein CEE40_13015 [Chloroflexi bacterium B3_Chlor]